MNAPPTKEGPRGMRAALAKPALRLQSDERLVELTRAGSDPAFEAIVERYRSPLLRYSSRLLGPDRAEDVVQRTFINALPALRADERQILLKPWLYRVTRNLTINALEEKGWDHEQIDPQHDGVAQPHDVFERRQHLREVVRQVKDLPERQRSAIVLQAVQGLSYEQVANRLDATPPVVRQLLHRARIALRNGLGALVPSPLLRPLLVSAHGDEHQRIAELATGAGASGALLKAGAGVLAAGAIATGAGVARHHHSHSPAKSATLPVAAEARASSGLGVADSPSSAGNPSGAKPRRHQPSDTQGSGGGEGSSGSGGNDRETGSEDSGDDRGEAGGDGRKEDSGRRGDGGRDKSEGDSGGGRESDDGGGEGSSEAADGDSSGDGSSDGSPDDGSSSDD